MRSFGTTVDNLIDEELAYGASNYELVWYKNEKLVDIHTSKLRFHFGGPKMPIGSITKDYIEIETDYMDFYKGDAIRIDIEKGGKSISVGTFYVDKFTKKDEKATYTAYSSLLDLSKIKLNKYEGEKFEAASEYARIKDIAEFYLTPLGITFDSTYIPWNNMLYVIDNFDWEELSVNDIVECVALGDACNFTLQGNILHKKHANGDIAKVYQTKDVVYTNSKSKHEEDSYVDCIKMNYTVCKWARKAYYEQATYVVAPYGTENNVLELNFKLIIDDGIEYITTQYFDELITESKVLLNDYEVSFLGDPRVEIGDVISFESEDGTVCTFRVGELVWEWDGGLKCTASTGSVTTNQSSAGGFTSVQQMADAIVSMSNSLMTVRYNAVYTDELYAKVADLGFANIDELSAEVANMGLMTAEEADIKYMTADSAAIKYATIESLNVLQGSFNSLNSKAITTDNLTTEVAKIGYLSANEADLKYLTATSADLKYANIDLSNIAAGTITDAMIANGAIGTAQIADGSITDAKIVGLTANKITAGTLDAATIEVVNLNAANITVGTINGQQIASGTISLDNLASDVTQKLADTEEDVAQAVADAKQAILDSASATSTANTANSNASTALSTANSANTIASTASTNASTALSTANTAKTTADAAQKRVYASFNGNGKSNGYFKVATLKITGTYINTDVVIGAVSRGYGYSTVQIMFASANSKDPSLSYFRQNGKGAWYIYKSATSTWDIYCKKNENYGSCTIVDYVPKSGITLTWNGADASADLPSGATRATQMAGQALWCYNNDIAYLDGAVIYAGTVVANAIAAGAIVSDKIASSAVTAVKIASGAISTDKLAANAVTAAKIASGTITATQIAASTITGAKIASGTITATNIASSAITTDKIVASAVTAAKIATSAITTDKLAANAVTAAKIAAGTITATQIAASTITAAKLNVTSLSAISANLGTVTAGVIKSTNYVANSAGMKLDLSTGVWDSKYFKLSNTGAITATSGKIGCFDLSSTGLTNSVLKIISNGSNTAQLSVYKPSIADPIFDVGMSSSWNYFTVTTMNEITLSADDVYLNGSVWVKNDISTQDGISLRTLNSNLQKNGTCKLLASVNSGNSTVTLSDSVDNYKYLLMFIGDSAVTTASFMIPVSVAKAYVSTTNAIAFGIDTTRLGSRIYALATYKSTKSLYLQVTSGYSCSIYGIC